MQLEPTCWTDVAPLASVYHENSKLFPATAGYLAETIGDFASDPLLVRRTASAAKTYPGTARVELARGSAGLPKTSLVDALRRRRSQRRFDARTIALPTIAALLESALGVTGELAEPGGISQQLRAAPSGGGLYSIESYWISGSPIGHLPLGIYHYQAEQQCLELVVDGDQNKRLAECLLPQAAAMGAGAWLVLTARWDNLATKYGERGYRIALLEAGHAAQNVLLVAAALGLAACPLAAFYDDPLGELLQLQSRRESAVYLLALGYASEAHAED